MSDLYVRPYVGLTDDRIKLGQFLFMRHGGKIVFFGRFIAILRCLAAFLDGVNQMPWPRFLIANAAGAILWAAVIGLGAYLFGKAFHQIVGPTSLALLALAIAAVMWGVIYLRHHEAKLQAEAERALLRISKRKQRGMLRIARTWSAQT